MLYQHFRQTPINVEGVSVFKQYNTIKQHLHITHQTKVLYIDALLYAPGFKLMGREEVRLKMDFRRQKRGGVEVWAMNPVSLIASKTHRPRGAETKSVILNIKGRRPRWIPPDSAFR